MGILIILVVLVAVIIWKGPVKTAKFIWRGLTYRGSVNPLSKNHYFWDGPFIKNRVMQFDLSRLFKVGKYCKRKKD